VLVVFPRGGVPVRATDELHRLVRHGVRPVVAHPDRYAGCTLEQVRAWRHAGALIQSDAMALVGRGRGSALGQAMLAHGFIDLLASDNHGDRRSLAASVHWLAANGGEEQLPLLTQHNPQRLLADQDPLPVPPLRPSVARRLQRWLGRWHRRR
jgi:protein-tyrosine phosphatase